MSGCSNRVPANPGDQAMLQMTPSLELLLLSNKYKMDAAYTHLIKIFADKINVRLPRGVPYLEMDALEAHPHIAFDILKVVQQNLLPLVTSPSSSDAE